MKVIALGNRLRGDDAIGPVVLDKIENKNIPIPLQLIEAGSDAFTLLEHLTGSEPVLIVDCADMDCPAGTVKVFDVNDKFVLEQGLISLHGFSLAEVLAMARTLGPLAPCKIIGVQPAAIEFNRPLSPTVEKALPTILNLISEEATQYAKKSADH